ncbi:hypothetical protein, partial [Burkholderia ubonensis]|uniref:hypothetical protein n=1 Tax=Burkholderia ubonensis TaxID=101571 RepID=UPI002109D0DA
MSQRVRHLPVWKDNPGAFNTFPERRPGVSKYPVTMPFAPMVLHQFRRQPLVYWNCPSFRKRPAKSPLGVNCRQSSGDGSPTMRQK